VKEWRFNKNIKSEDMKCMVEKGRKRALDGKQTEFFHEGTRVSTKKMENFKRRRMGEKFPEVGRSYSAKHFSHLSDQDLKQRLPISGTILLAPITRKILHR
jgi:hypothetical protein